MKLRRLAVTTAALGLAATVAAPAAFAAPASAHAHKPLGEKSLAEVLLADGDTFDHNWNDYDILTEAVLAVLKAKPDSAVGVLADGSTPLTAFLPNDRAFQALTKDLTGTRYWSEKRVFTKLVAAAGVDAIEAVLLYHVVPGATITKRDAAKANGARLKTAQGGTIKVRVYNRSVPIIELKDKDYNDANPFLDPRALDINKGNKQIAHGIVFVLRPLDL